MLKAAKTRLLNLVDDFAMLPGVRRAVYAISQHKTPVFLLHRANDASAGVGGYKVDELLGFVERLQDFGVDIISLGTLADRLRSGAGPSRPSVVFTADDGYRDQATVLGRAFADRGLPLTIFLITDFLDGKLWPWDAKIAHAFAATERKSADVPVGRLELRFDLSDEAQRRRARREVQLIAKTLSADGLTDVLQVLESALEVSVPDLPPDGFAPMSWEQARELETQGIGFAPHSLSHRVLSRLSVDVLRRELQESRRRLAEELGSPVNAFAWPIGREHDFGAREIAVARELEFDMLLTACDGYASSVYSSAPLLIDRLGFSLGDAGDMSFRLACGVRRLRHSDSSQRRSATRATDRSVLSGLTEIPTRGRSRRVRLRSAAASTAAAVGQFPRPGKESLARVERLVFVCTGNICRSPYAEVAAQESGLRSISCGLEANGTASADLIGARIAFARGIDLSRHRSRNIAEVEIGKTDLILGMQPSHMKVAESVASKAGAVAGLLGLWCSISRPWIEDPFELKPEAFDLAFDLIDEAVSNLRAELEGADAPITHESNRDRKIELTGTDAVTS